MNKTPEECLHTLINPLTLSIGLRVVRRTHFQANTCQLEEVLPEFACKHKIPVKYDRCR
jgi:hypothetical protein